LALGALLATSQLSPSRTGAPSRTSPRAAATIATTTTTTTTAATTTTATARAPAAPQTPDQAIAAARAAITAAQDHGQLDPSAATELNHRLDDISRRLQHPNAKDAAHKLSDLPRHLDRLTQAEQH